MVKKILVVDDEPAIVTLLKYNIENEGYQVTTCDNGQAAFELALANSFDFILLDLMLPGLDGIEVTKRLRQEKVQTPIIMITAKNSEYDKIIGLELGADDYLTKPFSPREVIARLKAISRRLPAQEAGQLKVEKERYHFADFTVDLANVAVVVHGRKVKLTPKEFELLAYFVKRPNRVLSRDKLLSGVWGYDYAGQTRLVDMHVSHLREKIEPNPKQPQYIQTIRGFGYRFTGEVNET